MTTQVRKATALCLAGSILLASCSSSTTIISKPSGAKVYLNGQPVGTTPYTHSDTRIVGSTTTVRLEKEGYETLNTSFSRDEQADVGAIIGGVFLLVPFLWTMKYNPTHTYELIEAGFQPPRTMPIGVVSESVVKSKADKLRELKQLLDEKLITPEDYEKQKAKILSEEK
ncbi:hypothetical protein GCM10023187_28610 [Nibrella viscosa]|uniref:PEGA domain-containing protein n=1 Tax=Nibrella viscosa TaxID=1084524 RepID=A0ABP8KJ25_9BACT